MSPSPYNVKDPRFISLKEKIIEATGLVYFRDKDETILHALTNAFRGALPQDLDELHQILLANANHEFDLLVDELTIGETFFFRHQEMFEALKNVVLPQILEKNQQHKLLRIWSAGCSIGAEPYSIAILLHEILGTKMEEWKIEIVGTDINRKFLRSALKGIFAPWALRGMNETQIRRYFDPHAQSWELKAQYKQNIHFRYYNLVSNLERIPEDFYNLDLLICRNVMIYFDSLTNQKLIQAFHQCLHGDGWLLLGHAEHHPEIYRKFHALSTEGAMLYQKLPKKAAVDIENPPTPFPTFSFPPCPTTLSSKNSQISRNFQTPKRLSLPKPPAPQSQGVTPQASVTQIKSAIPSEEELKQNIWQLCNEGNFVKARLLCDALLPSAIRDSSIYYLSGIIHWQLGHWNAAKEELQKRLFFQRDCVMTLYQISLLPQEGSKSLQYLHQAQEILSSLNPTEIIPLSDGLSCTELRLIIEHQIKQLS